MKMILAMNPFPLLLSMSFSQSCIPQNYCHRSSSICVFLAFSSILHSNPSFASIVSMNGIGVLCGILTSIAHSSSSSALSPFAGPFINKTYSRYRDPFLPIDQITRLLLLFFILGNLSFAVTSNLGSFS